MVRNWTLKLAERFLSGQTANFQTSTRPDSWILLLLSHFSSIRLCDPVDTPEQGPNLAEWTWTSHFLRLGECGECSVREVPSSSNLTDWSLCWFPTVPTGGEPAPTLLYALSGVALIRASWEILLSQSPFDRWSDWGTEKLVHPKVTQLVPRGARFRPQQC